MRGTIVVNTELHINGGKGGKNGERENSINLPTRNYTHTVYSTHVCMYKVIDKL